MISSHELKWEEKIEDARLRRDAIKQQAITLENIYKIMVNFDCVYNRPLAKLDKAIKIADTSNQGKAKCETASAVSIAFREDTKPFDKADSVFNKDTYLRDLAVIFALLFGQQMSLGTLFRQKRIGVYQGKTLVSGIRLQHRFCLDMDTRILE